MFSTPFVSAERCSTALAADSSSFRDGSTSPFRRSTGKWLDVIISSYASAHSKWFPWAPRPVARMRSPRLMNLSYSFV